MIEALGLEGVRLLDPWFLLLIPVAVLGAAWRARRPRAGVGRAHV